MEAMIVGDTRCGKGYVAEKLMEYFGVGEVVNGENCSFAGLVGGVQQLGSHWVITWGKIPLNDCGILTVDESGGMEENMWGKLSRVRSEGIAEITKIQTETANARTRLLWVCNAPNRTIASYTYGIQAINDLIKAPEDVARFDYVLVVAHDEVKGNVINKRREPLPILHDAKLEQELIMWCWSRKPNEVRFEPEAIKSIYERSVGLEKIYDFSIPLILV
jgi:DNA replicative helicase MCM subunit Mcm2 (Cdc46/Mcm family)